MSVFHSQVKVRVQESTDLNVCTPQHVKRKQAGISSSLQRHSQPKGVSLNPCVCDSHGTLTHSSTSSRCENKNPAPFAKIQSLTSEVLGNLFACWSVMSWLAHILSWPLFSFTDFFHSAARSRDGWMDGWRRGWSPGICLA